METLQFTLYSRSYCHLCQDMLDALQSVLGAKPHVVEVIDIDLEGNEDLLAQYDELVPVLCARKADGSLMQICHYFLDLPKLNAFLDEAL